MKARETTLGNTFSEIARDLISLVADTLVLARAEGRLAARAAIVALVTAVAALTIAMAGALTLVAALVLVAVAFGLPPWAAALVVGGTLVLGGLVAFQIATEMLRRTRFEFAETR